MQRLTTIAEVRAAVAVARQAGRRIGFVPTMGALHEGHVSLVRDAARHSDFVVVSIFVNPIQFDRPDDLAAYPRDLEDDEARLRALGSATPAIVFAPTASEMYPHPRLTTVTVTQLTDRLCGAARPGHFDGVATVCTKLFNIVQPDVAVFGRKDFQQLQVIRRLVADLDLPVEIVAGRTVREPDGVALSSRNRRLDPAARAAACSLSQALRAGVLVAVDARERGERPSRVGVEDAVSGTLARTAGVDVDYVEVLDPDTLTPPDDRGEAVDGDPSEQRLLVAVAAFVGPVRLIDNVVIGDPDDETQLLQATAG